MIAFNEFWAFCYDFIIQFQAFTREVWLFLNSEWTFPATGESVSILSICFGLGVGIYLTWILTKFLIPV